MRRFTIAFLATVSAAYLLAVAMTPHTWRACIADAYGRAIAEHCAADRFRSLAECERFNASAPYGHEASCY